jgi:hypothetical protein
MELRDSASLTRICEEIADELMERQAGGASRLRAAAMMRSIQEAITRLQALPERRGDTHLPPQILSALGLAPEGLGKAMTEASQRHLADCPVCRRDLALVKELSASLPQNGRARSVESGTGSAPIPLEVAASRSRDGTERGIDFRGERDVVAPRRLLSVWLLVAVAAIALWLVSTRETPIDSAELEGVARLADLSPPPIQRLSELPRETQVALQELSQGQCHSAATRLRGLREAHPDEPRLYLLEGASFVCAADGRRALISFDELERAVEDRGLKRPRQIPWYRAQAHLLEGDVDGALKSLEEVERVDAQHRSAARKLSRDIEASQMR